MRGIAAILLGVLALGTASGRAGDNWSDAQRLFSTSRFREAAVVLEREAKASPRSPEVWFNLGQARFQASDIGLARVAWERAAALSPRDPEIRGALELARGKSQSPEEPGWIQALEWLTREEWSILLLAATGFLGATFAAGKSVGPAVRWMRVAAVLAHAGLAALWIGADFAAGSRADTVVVAREASLLQSPVTQAKPLRALPEGAVFRAGRTHGAWVEVLQDGRGVGWVGRDATIRIRD
ncbi:MAG: tetratricopeptide repeat protein [Verrucomicrobia bacterium]|nr:MAG: tetratricopeptide repeat protein [Verrucomicrobiota bacterium]